MTAAPALEQRIDRVRAFNRYYTRAIGVLDKGLLDSPYSLTEARVLWELAHHAPLTATALGRELKLDAGYLSRLLRRFKERGLVHARTSKEDARQQLLSLTPKGQRAFAPLDQRSHDQTAALLQSLGAARQQQLVDAMRQIQAALGDAPERPPWTLRSPRSGDIGWVIRRHGELYGQEYGWDWRFEALVARICADFVDHFKPEREACWIAEQDGRNIGCVFLVQAAPTVAQLRMLLVEPDARGQGVGEALVQQCEQRARALGFRKIRLWTNSVLTAARHIYQKAGYRLVKTEPHESFGHRLMGETWELRLDRPCPATTRRGCHFPDAVD